MRFDVDVDACQPRVARCVCFSERAAWHGRLHVRVRVRLTCPGAVVCDYETLGDFSSCWLRVAVQGVLLHVRLALDCLGQSFAMVASSG
jgi:hypothetical protein